jgi:hypothetical protein
MCIDKCSVCGSTELLMTVVYTNMTTDKWHYGMKKGTLVIKHSVRYCNTCMLERVWYKTK